MDCHNLYFGHVSPQIVQEAVKDEEWQSLRRSLKGLPLQDKYNRLCEYLESKTSAWNHREIDVREILLVKVRITNYVTALSRGGLIKPEDYR